MSGTEGMYDTAVTSGCMHDLDHPELLPFA